MSNFQLDSYADSFNDSGTSNLQVEHNQKEDREYKIACIYKEIRKL